jgi:cell division protein FtsQ
LMKFAAMDGSRPLLGRGWLRFDMRDPTKLVARKPGLNQNHALADPAKAGDMGSDPASGNDADGAASDGAAAPGAVQG